MKKKSPANESVLKMRGSERKRREAAQRRAKRFRVMAKAKTHARDTSAQRDACASSASIKANAGVTIDSTAKELAANMPPSMAARKQYAADRKRELEQSPKWVQKENARLNALIVKLTKSGDNVKPKQRYFDENWLAARWGMSVKHIRNLRSAGVGPLVTYFGRSVRYRLRDVVAFEKGNAFASRTAKEQAKKS